MLWAFAGLLTLFLGLSTVVAGAEPGRESENAHRSVRNTGSVTFGKPVPIPSGYYELCRRSYFLCRHTAGWGFATTADGAVIVSDRLMAQVVAVNSFVNRSMKPVADSGRSPLADRWTVGGGAGDCEDFALTKKRRLINLGWPSSALLMALARTRAGQLHAVLIVRTDRGDVILDNLSEAARPWDRARYDWLKIQSPRDAWVWNTM